MKQTNIVYSLLALFGLQLLFVAAYVGTEHTFYYWDLGMYHAFAKNLFLLPDLSTRLTAFTASFSQNYNDLFSLPALLGMSLFGTSREVYILSNFLFYFVPFELVAARLLSKLFQNLSYAVALLLVFLVAPTVIPLWTPLFEGFPDHAATLFIGLGLLFSLRPRETTKDRLLSGLCFALAIILRRHFAYAAVAFFIGQALQTPRTVKTALPYFLKLFAMGCALSLLVCLIEPSYVAEVAVTNFRALYKSYEEPFPVFLTYIFSTFGFLSLALSAAAFSFLSFPEKLGLQKAEGPQNFSQENRKTARTLFLFCGIWILVWGLGPSQLGPHHLMPILPLFVLLGTASSLLLLYRSPFVETEAAARLKKRAHGLLIAISCLLVGQFIWGSLFAPSAVFTKVPSPPRFFAEPHPPLRRGDYQKLVTLARDLIRLAKPEDKIVIVGSSALWNEDLVRAIFTDELHNSALLRHFIWAPEIDHHQPPPFTASTAGTLYVVPSPAQYHLDPKGQTVVTALQNQFPPTGERAKNFVELPERVELDQGVTLSLWRRLRQTPRAAQESNDIIEKATKQKELWSVLKQPLYAGTEAQNEAMSFLFVFSPVDKEAEILFNTPMDGAPVQLSFTAFDRGTCEAPRLEALSERPDGTTLTTTPLSLAPSFSTSLHTLTPEKGSYLLLRLVTTPTSTCNFILQNLTLRR